MRMMGAGASKATRPLMPKIVSPHVHAAPNAVCGAHGIERFYQRHWIKRTTVERDGQALIEFQGDFAALCRRVRG